MVGLKKKKKKQNIAILIDRSVCLVIFCASLFLSIMMVWFLLCVDSLGVFVLT